MTLGGTKDEHFSCFYSSCQLRLKSNLINAHRDALKANHLSVNSVAKKKKANKLFLPSGDNLLNFSQALHYLITRKWTFELNTVKDIFPVKVKKIYENSLHLIPSPSVKIQCMGGNVCFRCKGKTFYIQKFGDNTQQCFSSKLSRP